MRKIYGNCDLSSLSKIKWATKTLQLFNNILESMWKASELSSLGMHFIISALRLTHAYINFNKYSALQRLEKWRQKNCSRKKKSLQIITLVVVDVIYMQIFWSKSKCVSFRSLSITQSNEIPCGMAMDIVGQNGIA